MSRGWSYNPSLDAVSSYNPRNPQQELDKVIDITFSDNIRQVLHKYDKTLEDYVKNLERFMKDASQGSLRFLEKIQDKNESVVGMRYTVPASRAGDVLEAAQARISSWDERTESVSLSSASENVGALAYIDKNIKLYDKESKKAFPKLAKQLGIRINKAQTGSSDAYNISVPTTWMPPEFGVDSSVATYVSNYEKESKRKSEKEQTSLDEKQERTTFFNKSLLLFGGISETVRRIFGVVSKLYDNALKASYTAQAANVNPDKLRQLEYALQGFGFDKSVAGSAIGLISGGLMNPLQLNENLVDTLAPIMGKSTADMVNEMLLGGGDTLSALTMIMEGARRKVAAGGMTGTSDAGKAFAEVFGQLKTAGGSLEQMFQAYMKAVAKANKQGWDKFNFSDFLELFPAVGTGISADAALQKYFLGAQVQAGSENVVYGATYTPGTTYRNFKWKGNPFNTEEGFLKALNRFGYSAFSEDDIFKLEPTLKELKSSGAVGGEALEDLKRLLDTITDMRARKWQTNAPYWDTNGFDLPFNIISDKDAFIGPAMERAAQGFSGFLNSGGVNYFDYTTNNASSPAAQGLGRAQIDMNLKVNGKDAGIFPMEFGPDNFIVSGDITVVT